MFLNRICLFSIAKIVFVAALTLFGLTNPAVAANRATDTIQTKQKIYRAVGVIKEVNRKERSLKIRHEDIEGLMEAMTMDFDVQSSKLLRNLKIGDKVAFELTSKSLTIVKIKKIK